MTRAGPAGVVDRSRPVQPSVDELVAGCSRREPLDGDDGKSGATLEAITSGGRRYVLKHVGGAGDWVARASNDRGCRPLRVWASGLLDALPAVIDHAVVGAAYGPSAGEGAVLQRDVGRWLVPAGDGPLPWSIHRRFLEHMATMHAAFWDFTDTVGLLALEDRYRLMSPRVVAEELRRGDASDPLPLVASGWQRLDVRAPRAASVVRDVLEDPTRLATRLRATPQTFLHGDWKAGNLGAHADGRTVLIDWSLPGPGPATSDLTWYLAINAARLPESKERAIDAYHAALSARGVRTAGWWEPQLELSALGTFAVLGWEKALGSSGELGWWVERIEAAARWMR